MRTMRIIRILTANRKIIDLFVAISIFTLSIFLLQGCTTNNYLSNNIELISPANNSTNLSFNNVELVFNATIGKTYDVIVKDAVTNVSVFSKTVTVDQIPVKITIPYGRIEPNKNYKWYVRLTNNDAKASAQWVFSTKPNSAPTVSDLRPNGTSGHPFGALALSWKANDPDGDEMSFKISVYEAGKEIPFFVTTASTDTVSIKGLKQQTKYTWMVEVEDRWGGKTNSSTAQFTTKANEPPERIDLISPESLTSVKFNNLLLKWQGFDRDYEDLKYTVFLRSQTESKALISSSPITEFLVTGLKPNTVYTLTIEAYDNYGSSISRDFTFRTKENTPPSIPNLLEPSNNSKVNLAKVSSLKFRWEEAIDPDEDYVEYRFVIRSGASERFMDPVNINELSFQSLSTFFKVGQQYQWYVIARDKHGMVATSTTFSFETFRNNPPTVPSNPYPRDDKDGTSPLSNRIEFFSWNSSDPDNDELKYDFYIGESPENLRLRATDLRSPNFYPSELFEYGKRYYWKVTVKDGYNDPVEGPIWTFKIKDMNNPPTPPVLVSPINKTLGTNFNNVVLKWQASTDPDDTLDKLKYYVYIGTADNMMLVQTIQNQTAWEISVNISNLNPITTYYWRVGVEDPEGNFAYSETWEFRTKPNTAPNWPSNPNPSDGQVLNVSTPVNLTFSWSASDPDADKLNFEFYISKDPTFASVSPVLLNTTTVTIPFSEKGKYYWYIVAKDPHGGITKGDVWNFELK